jgi:hypothetical protein
VTIEVGLGYLPPAPLDMPTGPGLERTNLEISGCPALTKWAATELGTGQQTMEIFAVNGLASTVNIQPCEAYSNLRKAANILNDADGSHLAALTLVINEYAFGNAPLSTEQIASIADVLSRNRKSKNQYGIAEQYLAALSEYVTTLNMELAFSPEESVQFAYEKYVDRLALRGHVAVADYLAARLNSLSVFLSMTQLEPANPYGDW